MTTLTIMPSGKTIDVAPGSSLLQAILDAGEKLVTQCGGGAKCGGCHVFVTEGRRSLTRATAEENAKLDATVGVSSKSRLACQAMLGTEAVTIELLGAMSGF